MQVRRFRMHAKSLLFAQWQNFHLVTTILIRKLLSDCPTITEVSSSADALVLERRRLLRPLLNISMRTSAPWSRQWKLLEICNSLNVSRSTLHWKEIWRKLQKSSSWYVLISSSLMKSDVLVTSRSLLMSGSQA